MEETARGVNPMLCVDGQRGAHNNQQMMEFLEDGEGFIG